MSASKDTKVETGQNGDRSVSDEDTKPKGHPRKRIASEDLSEDERTKLEKRREYNRKCAAKARQKSKDLIANLQKEVEELKSDKIELQRANDVMRAQLQLLENQNRTLMMNQRQAMGPQQGGFGGPGGAPIWMGNAPAGMPDPSIMEAIASQQQQQNKHV